MCLGEKYGKTNSECDWGRPGRSRSCQPADSCGHSRQYEMRPVKMTDAHKTEYFAELVCSNSLRADGLGNAVGVLKEEMTMNHSLIIEMARKHAVPAGGSLSVDRFGFSEAITDYLSAHPLVNVIHEEVAKIPEGPTIIATGPLTSDGLAKQIADLLDHQEYFYFYDAAAPIVTKESIDFLKLTTSHDMIRVKLNISIVP